MCFQLKILQTSVLNTKYKSLDHIQTHNWSDLHNVLDDHNSLQHHILDIGLDQIQQGGEASPSTLPHLIAHLPIALTDFLTKSQATSVAYAFSSESTWVMLA